MSVSVYEYLLRGCSEDGGGLFSVVPRDKAQGIFHKLKYRKFLLIIKRLYCACVWLGNHWNRFPRKVVVPP